MVGPRGTSTTGDLQILARIGVGGMGEVLLARRTGASGFEKLVALKTIRSDLAEHADMRRMFIDEARLLARLDHPAIAQVYELRDSDGALELLMEYVPGIPLGTLLKRRKGPVPPGIAAQMAAEAARGLHAAHELTDLEGRSLGVIHRDISPQNLILTFDGRIKVLDFGVAFVRDREAATTEAGVVKGKLAYLSPEQIQGKQIDRRADLYALSVVLHELLTGRRLFGRGESIADAVKRGRVAKPSSSNKEVPAELDRLVLKGLAKDPNDRFADAREMALALDGFARQAGSESLEAYTLREMTTEREQHRAWLQRVASNPEATTQRGSGTESLSPLDLIDIVTATPRPPPNTGPRLFLLTLLLAGTCTAAVYLRPDWVELAQAELSALAERAWPSPEPPALAPPPVVELPPPPAPEPVLTTSVAAAQVLLVDTSSLADTLENEQEEDEEPDEPIVATSTPAAPPPPVAPPPAAPPPAARPHANPVVRRPPPPPPKAPPSKPVAAKVEKAPVKRPPRPGYGALSIAARPGGTIYVDGRRIGGTPLDRHRLKVGRYVVTLKRPGDGKPRWRSTVNINEGKLVRITLR